MIFKTQPFMHQLRELHNSLTAECYAYFWEQGTGKTKLILDRSANMYANGHILGTLVLSMNGPHADFIREGVRDHWPDSIPIVARPFASGMGKRKAEIFEQVLKPDDMTFRLMTINYEAIIAGRAGMEMCQRFIKSCSGRVLIVADESDLIKTPSAKQTRSAWSLAKLCKYRVIMTGTEVTQGPLDLYAQTQFLKPGIMGCPNFATFRNRYAEWRERVITSGAGSSRRFQELVRYRNMDEMKQRLKTFSSVVRKDDCLDLPPKVYVTRTVVLGAEQRKHYELIKDRVLAECEYGTVTTEHALTKLLRLSQVTGGFLPLDDEEAGRALPNAKLALLLHDVETIPQNQSIIVWARFRAELELLTKELSAYGKVARYWGAIPRDTRASEAEEFKKGERRFIVAQPQAGGRGHTWLAGTTVMYFSNNYSWSNRAQSEDRPHRIGQVNTVTYFDYVAEDTVDVKIVEALKQKQNIAEYFKDHRSIKDFLQ